MPVSPDQLPFPTPAPLSPRRAAGFPTRGGVAGFSLLQLLVCIAVVLILATLLFPVINAQSRAALSLKCVHHLRTIGAALGAYAADRDGMLPPRNLGNNREKGKPDATLRPWGSRLFNLGYLENVDVLYCPAFTPKNAENARGDIREGKGLDTYGMRTWSPPDLYGTLSEEEKRLSYLEKPSKFFIIGDSYWSAFAAQGYGITPGNASQAVHLRHSGEANLLFADGHVEAKGADYFKTLHHKENQAPYMRGTPTKDGKEIFTTTEGL